MIFRPYINSWKQNSAEIILFRNFGYRGKYFKVLPPKDIETATSTQTTQWLSSLRNGDGWLYTMEEPMERKERERESYDTQTCYKLTVTYAEFDDRRRDERGIQGQSHLPLSSPPRDCLGRE